MLNKTSIIGLLLISMALSIIIACDKTTEEVVPEVLSESDKEMLLFMLEEEKLARDTYIYLDSVWPNTPFANIKGSEQSHMDAIKALLDANGITYNILSQGQFSDAVLQNYYNQFIITDTADASNAQKIGATIEDLDIVDLKNYIKSTANQSVIDVFDVLECGSRNHLRSFMKSITSMGETYTPQFLTVEDFNSIISGSQEKCNGN